MLNTILNLLSLIFKSSSKKELDSYIEENKKEAEIKKDEVFNALHEKTSEKALEENQNEPMPEIGFKTSRVEKEYNKLDTKNSELKQLLKDVQEFAWDNFKKDIVITMIFRTEAEQDYLYRDSEK